MTKKTTLKHKLPCGRIETRTTAREYSHVVIARRNLVKEREVAGRICPVDIRNFSFYLKLVQVGVGGTYRHDNGLMSSPISQRDYDNAKAMVEGCADGQQFAEKCRDKRLADHDALHGNAEAGKWFVEGWCGRADLAAKLAASTIAKGWLRDVQAQVINGGN